MQWPLYSWRGYLKQEQQVNSALPLDALVQVLAQIIRSSEIPVVPTLRMEDNLTNFEDCLGGCERILRTPIPLYYTR